MFRPHRAVVLLACLLLAAPAPRAQVARHLAAPPSDIVSGRVVLPEPAALDVTATGAVLELSWQREADAWVAVLDVPVERAGPLSLGLVGIGAEQWAWELGAPGVAQRDLRDLRDLRDVRDWAAEPGALRVVEPLPSADDPRSIVGLRLATAGAGAWRVRVSTPAADVPSQGWLALRTAGDASVAMHSHLGTHRLLSDRAFSVVASLDGGAVALSGVALVQSAAGRSAAPLRDDGLHDDGAAGDGVFGAFVGPLPPGPARVAVQLDGPCDAQSPGGAACVRSVHHAFVVEEPAVVLAGVATSAVLDAQRLRIDVALQPLAALRRLHLSAEVWGPDAHGTPVSVAWLSTIGQPAETWGTSSLSLHLDGRWLANAGTIGPLELRRVRVQDPDSEVLFDERDAMPLPVDALPAAAFGPPGPVTSEMLLGPPPPGSTLAPAPSVTLGVSPGLHTGLAGSALGVPWKRALLLSHGYCSSGSIWPAADFTAPKIEFLDPNANRSNDEFAQLLAAAGAGHDSFGFVGHSQGGLAALHLLTYYTSGLDFAVGPRRIQSVAAPYQGTPLASLGFFACGVNNDMTTTGAPLWLAGIPTWARNEVFYWTTQNSGSACNFFTNLVLGSPNDGTVEKSRGQLPGGNNMGHVVGWCHTTGMSNPASYTDHARNHEMNAQGAR